MIERARRGHRQEKGEPAHASPAPPSFPQDFLQGDCTKARQKLNWKPRVAFDVSVSHAGTRTATRGQAAWREGAGRPTLRAQAARRLGAQGPVLREERCWVDVAGGVREASRQLERGLSPGESGRCSSLMAHPVSRVAGAGEGDGARRRGAHEDQPQCLSTAAACCPTGSPRRRCALRGSREGEKSGSVPAVLSSAALSPQRCRPPRFVAAGTWHSGFRAALLLSKPPLNDFVKSRCFNHLIILLEIVSVDNLNFGAFKLFFLIKNDLSMS